MRNYIYRREEKKNNKYHKTKQKQQKNEILINKYMYTIDILIS